MVKTITNIIKCLNIRKYSYALLYLYLKEKHILKKIKNFYTYIYFNLRTYILS